MIGIGRVSAKGQVVVPAEIRRKFGIKTGDKVIVTASPNGKIILAKAKQ